MAVDLNGTTDKYEYTKPSTLTDYPVTLFVVAEIDNFSINNGLLNINDASDGNERIDLTFLTESGKQYFEVRNSWVTNKARVNIGTVGVKYACFGECSTDTASTAYVIPFGGGTESSTADAGPGGINLSTQADIISIGGGRFNTSTDYNWCDGKIYTAAAWAATLDADERQALAKGVSPLLVRPSSLVFHVGLLNTTDVNDVISGLAPSISGTPADHPHTSVIYPPSTNRLITFPPALVAPLPLGSFNQFYPVFFE